MTPAQIQTAIDNLETKIQTFAGTRSHAFSDQQSTFSLDDAHKELSRLRGLLATASTGSSTRYAATSKGC